MKIGESGDADLLLEQLIDEHSHPRQLTIVSSDHRLHRAAKSRRAAATDSAEFLAFLEHRRHRAHAPRISLPHPAKPESAPIKDVAAAELAYWMSVFGDVKISELIEPDRPVTRPAKRSAPSAAPEAEPVAPRKKRSSTKSRATQSHTPEAPAESKSGPELFSTDWINELQRWVDEQQKP